MILHCGAPRWYSSLVIRLGICFAANKWAADATESVKFEPFKRSESYKCGQFIAENSINDPAMRLFHNFNNAFIRLLSRPFPHERLIDLEALSRPESFDLKASFQQNQAVWIDFEKYWLVFCVSLAVIPIAFTVFYLFYRCCACCCRGSRKSATEKRFDTDKRFDNCRRVLLNLVIAFFVFVNVFAAVILLVSTQYAQYGIEELPTRLHYCANDFSVYKSETSERIRKLLREDISTLNMTLVRNIDNVGEDVVERVKRTSGIYLANGLVEKTKKSEILRAELGYLSVDLKNLENNQTLLRKRLSKLKDAESGLLTCQSAVNAAKISLCKHTLQLIQPLINSESMAGEWPSLDDLIPAEASASLRSISNADLEEKFSGPQEVMNILKADIQKEVDSKRDDAIARLKALDDTMFRLFEDISSGIKSVDMRFLDEAVDPLMQNREVFRNYAQYSWIVSLVLAGIFVFIALLFLLGLFYGCCGRRPSYCKDGCCVKSTGSKFYSCGIWLSLLFMTLFACLTAVFAFVGANVSNLICLPMEDPLARPDMLSFVDRLVDAYGLSEEHESLAPRASIHLPKLFNSERKPADIIRRCRRGETFYTIFGLDKKYKLLNEGGPKDEYDEIKKMVKNFGIGKTDLPKEANFYTAGLVETLKRLEGIHVPSINESSIQKFRSMWENLEVEAVLLQLSKAIADKTPNAPPTEEVDRVLKYLEELKPDAQVLVANYESISQRLERLKSGLDGMNFANMGELFSRLQHTNSLLNSGRFNVLLSEAATEVAENISSNIWKYSKHINDSISTEVSGCAPIAEILHNTKAAICDHALDPFNGIWMAMTISILFMIPIIMISTTLVRLYARMYSYTKFTVNEPPNEATFATDYYGVEGTQRFKPSSVYASPNNNYAYQEFYHPPPYLNARS